MGLGKKAREVGLAGLVALLSISPGCATAPPKSYDNSTYKVTESSIDHMVDSAYRIESRGVYTYPDGTEVQISRIGTTFYAGEKEDKQYLITCDHVINFPETLQSRFNGDVIDFKYAKYFIQKDGKEYQVKLIRNNSEIDVAIVKTLEDLKLENIVEFAKHPLKRGDAIYAVGYPLGIGKFLSRGEITYVGNDNFFFESAELNPGNSGGPLFVLSDGKPYVAGVGQFMIRNAQGMYGAGKGILAYNELKFAMDIDGKLIWPNHPFPGTPQPLK